MGVVAVSGANIVAITETTAMAMVNHATAGQSRSFPGPVTKVCAIAGVSPASTRPSMRLTAMPVKRTRAGNCSGKYAGYTAFDSV